MADGDGGGDGTVGPTSIAIAETANATGSAASSRALPTLRPATAVATGTVPGVTRTVLSDPPRLHVGTPTMTTARHSTGAHVAATLRTPAAVLAGSLQVTAPVTLGGGELQRVRVVEAPLSLLDPRVGAALDGTGDQAAKVAAAIALLPSTGGHIYQPAGTLRTSAITLDRPVRWEGAGDQASTILAAAGFTGDLLTISSEFCHVHDVQIGGGGSATSLIKARRARLRLSGLHLTGSAGEGIWFEGTATNTAAHAAQVSNVRVLNCAARGVYVRAFGYDQEFTNLWVGSCGVGVRVENTNCLFSNLHVWGSTGNGVEVRGSANMFSNVYVETNGSSGFDVFNAPRTTISGGTIWKNQAAGINWTGTSDRCRAQGLTIYDQGGNGISGTNVALCQVIGCDFYDDTTSSQSQDRPVVSLGTSDNWIVVGNVCRAADHAVGGNSLVGAGNQVASNIV